MTRTLKIHETTAKDGTLEPVLLSLEDDDALTIGGLPVPDGAVEAVMARFGAALDTSERTATVASLDLRRERGMLRHVRHLDFGDVIARDYLVYEPLNGEPVVALATTVAGALTHLAHAAAGKNAAP
jgi:hypothetical protein